MYMKKCNNCGFSNDDDARFCAGCGSSLADAPVVNEQAAPVQADDPFAEPAAAPADSAMAYEQPQDQQLQEAKQKKGFKGTVASVKDKTVGFEKKHSVILNAIVIVCALVVLFVALFAPIKIVNYKLILPQTSVVCENYTEGKGDNNDSYTVHYVEVSQSIWQIIGASSYITADRKTLDELEEQLEKAEEAAEKEYTAWALANLDKIASTKEDSDAQIKAKNAMAEIYADHLSDVNILGYVLASGIVALDNFISVDEGDDPIYAVRGDEQAMVSLVQAYETVGLAAVIVILSIVAAIVSLVYLIKAIINMVKKQPQNKLYKYFGTMLGLSGAGLILSMCAPLLAPGGGMLAIAVFVSIMYFVCGAFGSFVFGKDGLLLSIKRTAIALLGMIAFFLLCTNVFAATTGNTSVESTVNAPMGYGFAGLFDGFIKVISVAGKASPSLAYSVAPGMITGIAGFVTFIWMIFTVSFLLSAYKRTLKRLAFGNVEKSSCTAFAITGAVFAIISIIVAMVVPGVMTNMIAEMFSHDSFELDVNEIVASFSVRAQVWVSMIFFLIVAIFNIVFNPKSKNPAANQGQQA